MPEAISAPLLSMRSSIESLASSNVVDVSSVGLLSTDCIDDALCCFASGFAPSRDRPLRVLIMVVRVEAR